MVSNASSIGLVYLPPELTVAIAALWKEEAIRVCFERGNEFGLPDNTL